MSTKTQTKSKAKKATAPAPAPAVTPLPGRTQLVELTAEQAQMVARLKANRSQAAELKKLIDADSDVLKAIGGNTRMIGVFNNCPVVRFGDGTWKGTDEKILAEAFPEAFAASRASKPYVTVTPL